MCLACFAEKIGMRILFIGLSKSKIYESKNTIKELKKRGHRVNFVLWRELVFSFSKKKGVTIRRKRGKDLKYYDFVICRSPMPPTIKKGHFVKTLAMSRFYRHFYLVIDYMNFYKKHVLNEKVIKKLPYYDKLFQYYQLAKAKLPVVPSLLYTGKKIPSSVYEKFPYPYIAKCIQGSKGRDVYKIYHKEKIRKLIEKYGWGRVMIQKYLPTKEDYRIIVIGKKVIGGMKRVAPKGKFKTNFSLGGYVEKIKVSKDFRNLALKAAKALDAEFAGVDIIKYKNKLYILEVNLFPGFQGFEQATKISVPRKLISYIEKKYLWSLEEIKTKKDKLNLLNELYQIEKESFIAPFSKKNFKKELINKKLITVKKEGKVIAYLTYKIEKRKAYISKIAVKEKYRRQKIASRLIKSLIKLLKEKRVKSVYVHIRESNIPSEKLFKKLKFKIKKIKKKYYRKRKENAIFMKLNL